MSRFIARQPNGLLCRFSTVVDCPTAWNMTEQEYINLCIEEAKEEAEREAKEILAKYVRPFNQVMVSFKPENMTKKKFEEFLKETAIKID